MTKYLLALVIAISAVLIVTAAIWADQPIPDLQDIPYAGAIAVTDDITFVAMSPLRGGRKAKLFAYPNDGRPAFRIQLPKYVRYIRGMDANSTRLYVSVAYKPEVIVFDLLGEPKPDENFHAPSANGLAATDDSLYLLITRGSEEPAIINKYTLPDYKMTASAISMPSLAAFRLEGLAVSRDRLFVLSVCPERHHAKCTHASVFKYSFDGRMLGSIDGIPQNHPYQDLLPDGSLRGASFHDGQLHILDICFVSDRCDTRIHKYTIKEDDDDNAGAPPIQKKDAPMREIYQEEVFCMWP